MGTVDLNDRLDDSLFYALHAVQLLVEDAACLDRIDGLKIIALPLNIHHHGESALCVTALFWRNLMRACNGEVAACPQTDVVWQGSSGTVHEIGDGLDTGELHAVSGFLLILILNFFFRCIAGKESFDHKL